ncbi:MAG TPA: TlpA family protein disulfide reductase [Gammaproteobacteria bacterium]|nr:TlpA family protein disulfide reductase [Gammaproteobacteria bacterium]
MKNGASNIFRTWLGITAVVVLAVSTSSAGLEQSAAPDFTLKSINGDNLRLSEFRGEVVLINFWASWCGPCRQEMPVLSELHDKYKALGFTVLGVNVEEEPGKARRLLKEMQVSFPVLLDNESVVSKQYNVVAMPSTVLVDRNGNMRYLHKGYKPGLEDVYLQQIRDLVRE